MIVVHRGPGSVLCDGAFRVRRLRPGLALSGVGPGALGPLSVVDHAELAGGLTIPMHRHRDDEILSYVASGSLVHRDTAGNAVTLSPRRFMMMSAGAGLSHEEAVPSGTVEMLQIFVRPHAPDLPGIVAFHDRPASPTPDRWNLIAGPANSAAPLIFRNDVTVLDRHLPTGGGTRIPRDPGKASWVYVLSGGVRADDVTLAKGDALLVAGAAEPWVEAIRPSVLVAFVVDPTRPGIRSGSISGRD